MSKLTISIIQAINDKNLFRPLFKDIETWKSWLIFLKALFALPLDETELSLYQSCTGRITSPDKAFREAWVPTGRRSGKSFIAALIAVFLACFRSYEKYLSAGERAHVVVIASDRGQAQVIFRYVKGFINSIPMLAAMLESEKTESIDLNNRVTISVMTCSYKGVRGFTLAAVICDEIAFWRADDGRNPATEVLRALRPALGTIPGALLIAISSPYSRSGPLWDTFNKHHGKDESDILCWQAATAVMNPTFSQATIDREMELDPENARAEYGAEFRSDLQAFMPEEAITAVTIPGRFELPPMSGVNYVAFVDPSGGRHDAACMAIAHEDKKVIVLDVARQWKAPHIPAAVIEEQAGILRRYGLSLVVGDRYGGEFAPQEYLKYGITYQASEKNKSEIYLDFLPIVLSGSIELLDNKTLFNELRSLERRTRSGGHDSVDHPPKGHDDLCNSCAGVCGLLGLAREPSFLTYMRREAEEMKKKIDDPYVPAAESPVPNQLINVSTTPRGRLKQGYYDWPMPQGGSSASDTMRAYNEAFSKFKRG